MRAAGRTLPNPTTEVRRKVVRVLAMMVFEEKVWRVHGPRVILPDCNKDQF